MRHWVLPPGVELLYLEKTEGGWGKPVEPDEEAAHLAHWLLDIKHVKYPVAIWAGPLDTLFDGGTEPRTAPFWKKMMGHGTPLFVVTDGHGVVRFRVEGYTPTWEPYRRVVNILITERAKDRHDSAALRAHADTDESDVPRSNAHPDVSPAAGGPESTPPRVRASSAPVS
jgi:hypothetical protein